MKMSTFLVCVLILCASSFLVSATYVTFANCTDKAFCLSGCVTATVPSGSCTPNSSPAGTQTFDCRPEMHVCGDITYFSDDSCENLWMTNGFVCDDHTTCNTQPGQQTARCRSRSGAESLEMFSCTQPNCSGCVSQGNVTSGKCSPLSSKWKELLGDKVPRGVSGGSFMYTGSALCTAVNLIQYPNSPDCASAPQSRFYPQDSCIMGIKLTCTWNQ